MKAIALAFLLSTGTMTVAQEADHAPADQGQLFQLPPVDGQVQQFKLRVPGGKCEFFALPAPMTIQPRRGLDPNVDKNMIVRPPRGSFAEQQPHPALPQKLYPGLKILPVEMASLNAAPLGWRDDKMEPIPITWPEVRFEPIPITWENLRIVPVGSGKAPTQSGPRK